MISVYFLLKLNFDLNLKKLEMLIWQLIEISTKMTKTEIKINYAKNKC